MVKTGNVKREDYVTTELVRKVEEVIEPLWEGYAIRVPAAEREKPYSGKVVKVVTNPFGHEIRGMAEWDLPWELWRVEPKEVEFAVAPGESKELVFELSGEAGALARAPELRGSVEVVKDRPAVEFGWKVYLAGAGEVWRMAQPIEADGTLIDWFDLKPPGPAVKIEGDWNVVAGAENWEGASDLSAHVYVGQAEDGIYVAAKVWDTELVAGSEENFREGDAIVLYFSAKPPREGKDPNRIFIRPKIGERDTDVNLKGALSEILGKAGVGTKSGGRGYNVEVKIAKEAVEELLGVTDAGSFLFDVGVRDFDGEGEGLRSSEHSWMGHGVPWRDPTGFGEMFLK